CVLLADIGQIGRRPAFFGLLLNLGHKGMETWSDSGAGTNSLAQVGVRACSARLRCWLGGRLFVFFRRCAPVPRLVRHNSSHLIRPSERFPVAQSPLAPL